MVNLGRMLKLLAQDFTVSVLASTPSPIGLSARSLPRPLFFNLPSLLLSKQIITASVSESPYFSLSNFATTTSKPPLGATWTEVSDVQVYFGFAEHGRVGDDVDND